MDCIGKNTGVGCHSFLQGIFPTQGSNPGLPHCRQILYQLSHQGSPLDTIWMGIISYFVFQHNSVLFFPSSWWAGLCNTRSIQSWSCFFLLHTISSQTPAPRPQGEAKFRFWWFRPDHKILVLSPFCLSLGEPALLKLITVLCKCVDRPQVMHRRKCTEGCESLPTPTGREQQMPLERGLIREHVCQQCTWLASVALQPDHLFLLMQPQVRCGSGLCCSSLCLMCVASS